MVTLVLDYPNTDEPYRFFEYTWFSSAVRAVDTLIRPVPKELLAFTRGEPITSKNGVVRALEIFDGPATKAKEKYIQ